MCLCTVAKAEYYLPPGYTEGQKYPLLIYGQVFFIREIIKLKLQKQVIKICVSCKADVISSMGLFKLVKFNTTWKSES